MRRAAALFINNKSRFKGDFLDRAVAEVFKATVEKDQCANIMQVTRRFNVSLMLSHTINNNSNNLMRLAKRSDGHGRAPR